MGFILQILAYVTSENLNLQLSVWTAAQPKAGQVYLTKILAGGC
jgi:hypothetical protein